jgi:hypothetical protein
LWIVKRLSFSLSNGAMVMNFRIGLLPIMCILHPFCIRVC